jgi:hypothetical protein
MSYSVYLRDESSGALISPIRKAMPTQTQLSFKTSLTQLCGILHDNMPKANTAMYQYLLAGIGQVNE